MALLEVEGLEKVYGRRKVVNGVSFDVNAGEVVGLLGPNGAGKTTSFRMATGQIAPNGGLVHFNGEDVTDRPMYRRARLGMGYLSQEQSIFRKLTVEKNLLAILEALPRSRTLGRRLTRAERWQRTEAALARFNLQAVRKNAAARCSGGEKRRLEIARCLVCEPLLILLDEPFAAVDPKTTEDIRRNVRDLANQGIGILLTDHNVREVVKTADRIYLIVEGKVVCHGTPEQLIRDPVAIDAYLGTTFEDDVLMARVAGFSKARRDEPPEPDAGTPAKPPPKPPAGGPADHREPETQPDLEPIPLDPIDWPASEPPRAPSRPAARSRPPAPPPTAPAPVLVDSFPASRNSTAIPNTPAPAAKLSGGVQQLLEHEKMRRLVEQLRDRNHMPTAWHELAGRGTAAVPVLLEALERREMEIRHLAFRLLESVTGEQLTFQSDAPEDVRLRQVAYLRAKLERRG
jgi:lipopolysaccharide export system ATP-binding protein